MSHEAATFQRGNLTNSSMLTTTWISKIQVDKASLMAQWVQNPLQCRTWEYNPWVGQSPGGGNGNLLQYSCLKNPMIRRAWQGYSPWGRKESDKTEHEYSQWQERIQNTWLLSNQNRTFSKDRMFPRAWEIVLLFFLLVCENSRVWNR